MPVCGHCAHYVPTKQGLRLHIRHKPDCYEEWKARLQNSTVNVFDIDGSARSDSLGEPHAPVIHDNHFEENMPDATAHEGGVSAPARVHLPARDAPSHACAPAAAPLPQVAEQTERCGTSHRPTMEEVEDEDNVRYTQAFHENVNAGRPSASGCFRTKFETLRNDLHTNHANREPQIWGLFMDKDEWDLAKWLVQTVGQTQAEEYLKLNIVSNQFLST